MSGRDRFEDEVREMLHRRAADIDDERLDADVRQMVVVGGDVARRHRSRRSAIGWVAAMCLVLVGSVGAWLSLRDADTDAPVLLTDPTPSEAAPTPVATEAPLATPTTAPTAIVPAAASREVLLAPGPGADFPSVGEPVPFIDGDGRLRVVYVAGPSTIDMAVCADVGCEEVETVTLVDIGPTTMIDHVGVGFDGDGRPMVLHTDARGGGSAGVVWCVDVDCAEIATAPPGDFVGLRVDRQAFATAPDGRRWLASTAVAGGGTAIRLTDCTDGWCAPTSGDTILSIADSTVLELVVAFGPDGTPVLLFTTQTLDGPRIRTLRYAACADLECSGEPTVVNLREDPVPDPGEDPTAVVIEPPLFSDGGVTILATSIGGGLPSQVAATHCAELTCATRSTTVLATGLERPQGWTNVSAALGGDGLPRLVWTDSNGTVQYVRCTSDDCAATEITPLELTATQIALATSDGANYLLTAGVGNVDPFPVAFPVRLVVCPAEGCRP